jgi:ribonuclease P protein component
MLAYANRFHGHSSLRYVFKNGETIRSRVLTLRVSTNKYRKQSRFSVSISKKVLKSAVKRNRIRRRIYEVVRLALPHVDGVYDVVFIVTSAELLTMEYDDLRQSVVRCLTEAGILSGEASS